MSILVNTPLSPPPYHTSRCGGRPFLSEAHGRRRHDGATSKMERTLLCLWVSHCACMFVRGCMSACVTNSQTSGVDLNLGSCLATRIKSPNDTLVSPPRTRASTCCALFVGAGALSGRICWSEWAVWTRPVGHE